MLKAVITGDIESSTRLSQTELNDIINTVKAEAEEIQHNGVQTEIAMYRGDSFQILVHDPKEALRLALMIKTAVNRLGPPKSRVKQNSSSKLYDLAISIGLGEVSQDGLVNEQNAAPHILSGRGLDKLKQQQLTFGLFTGHKENDKTYQTLFAFLNWMMQSWSRYTAELVYFKLKKMTETEISEQLGISQSAVNQRSKVACWGGIDQLVKHYETIGVHKYG